MMDHCQRSSSAIIATDAASQRVRINRPHVHLSLVFLLVASSDYSQLYHTRIRQ